MNILKSTLFFFLTFIITNLEAQSFEHRESMGYEKTSSLTAAQILDPGFDDFLVYWVRTGATVFNQKGYLIKVDKETLEEVDRTAIEIEKGEKRIYSNRAIEGPNCLYIPIYTNDKKNNKLTMSCYKIGSDLSVSDNLKELFVADYSKIKSSLKVYQNGPKDLLIFTYIEKKKKEKKDVFHYYVVDKDLNLVFDDAIDQPYKDKTKNAGIFIYDDGVAYIDLNDRSTIQVMDIRNEKLHSIKLEENASHNVRNIKQIENGNIVIVGETFTGIYPKLERKGYYRAELNVKTQEIIGYDSKKYSLDQGVKKAPLLERAFITDKGNAFYYTDIFLSTSSTTVTKFFQLHYFSNTGENWTKDLPIPMQVLGQNAWGQSLELKAFEYNGRFNMIYNDSKKTEGIDPNTYKIGKESPGKVNIMNPKDKLVSMLSVNSSGEIIRDSFYPESKNFLMGQSTAYGSKLYTPGRRIKGMAYTPVVIFEFDFKNMVD